MSEHPYRPRPDTIELSTRPGLDRTDLWTEYVHLTIAKYLTHLGRIPHHQDLLTRNLPTTQSEHGDVRPSGILVWADQQNQLRARLGKLYHWNDRHNELNTHHAWAIIEHDREAQPFTPSHLGSGSTELVRHLHSIGWRPTNPVLGIRYWRADPDETARILAHPGVRHLTES